MQRFDVIVVGTGSGQEVASAAAERGLSVAIVEHGPFGGTCLNRGCIPSKMLIHSADVMQTIRGAGRFGIKAEVTAVDWQFIVNRVTASVDSDAREVEEGSREIPNVTVFKDTARFVDRKVLAVGGEQISAETIIIAAGTRPAVPKIDGIENVPFITSDQALRLPEQPRRMIIVGGGYIAAELAHFFGALGSEVTIVEIAPRMLLQADDDIGNRFTEIYGKRFDLRLDTTLARVSYDGREIKAEIGKSGERQELTTDALLVAVGRVPNTDVLDVAETGVTVNERGFVKVDEYLQTEVPGIWALGDIVGRYQLKHSANLEAVHVAYNLFQPRHKIAMDYHAMPYAVFASPQVAGVGLTEREAEQQRLPYVAATYNYIDAAYGASIEDSNGFVKVLANQETKEILGCHILGTEASVLIQEVANAMRSHLTTDVITKAIYIHPALPEVVQRAFWSLDL
jgi:mycothione reductase